MKKSTWFIVISLLIITAGSTVFWSTMTREQTATNRQDEVVGQTQQADQTATPPAKSPRGLQPPTGHSKNTETIKLKAMAPYNGEATAIRSFDGTWFVLTIEADLPDPPAGKVYDAYLIKRSQTEKFFFFFGKLTKENGVYLRALNSTRDMPEHTEVLITEDIEGNEDTRQNEAAPQVFRGSFSSSP